MTALELRESMRQGVVSFKFQKKNGEIREAKGTTNMGLIPEENHPTSGETRTNDDVVCFFDVDKQAWRSFRTDSLVTE